MKRLTGLLVALWLLWLFPAEARTAGWLTAPGTFLPARTDTTAPAGHTATAADTARRNAVASALADSTATPIDTLRLAAISDSLGRKAAVHNVAEKFIPNPKRALWLALVLPGAGQIYNRKYWKLAIFYGGFLGCTYALTWNQQMYMDYSQAYLDIMDDDPATDSYLDMLPPRYDITGREEQFKTIFKNRKDRYRRYRDLSAFCFVGVYLLSVIDAYVDAQLSVFDISPDLSLRVGPAVINNNSPLRRQSSYGLGCSFNF